MIYSGLQFILKLIPRRISAQKKMIHTDMEVFCNIDQDFYRAIGASPFKIAEVAMGNTKFFIKFFIKFFLRQLRICTQSKNTVKPPPLLQMMKSAECSTQFSIKTIFIMLHSFCRAYEKAGIFLAFIILQTDD